MNGGGIDHDVESADLHRGEALGMAGLLGAGRTEALRAIFGADPRGMERRGIGYTPENRKEAGLAQDHSARSNLRLASLDRVAPRFLLSRAAEQPYVRRRLEGLAIKAADAALPASSLSGGNQQKVVIGNWPNTEPQAMFFDEPGRGTGVQAKQQVFDVVWREAARGLSLVSVSSEPGKLLKVAGRILVTRGERVVADVLPERTTLAEPYRLCVEGA